MKQRASRYEKIISKQVELPSWEKEYIKLYRRLKENIKSNERELKIMRQLLTKDHIGEDEDKKEEIKND